MTRKADEIILVNNLIDFDPAAPMSPRALVEWWASQFFLQAIKQPPKGFNLSPLTFIVERLKRTSTKEIVEDYILSLPDSKLTEDGLYETVFLNHCREVYRSNGRLNVSAPKQFALSEITCAVLDLSREIEDFGEVNAEDMPL